MTISDGASGMWDTEMRRFIPRILLHYLATGTPPAATLLLVPAAMLFAAISAQLPSVAPPGPRN